MTNLQARFFHDFIKPVESESYYIGALSTNADTLSGRITQTWGRVNEIDEWLSRLDPIMSSLPHSINYTPVLRSAPNSKENTVSCATVFWVDIDDFLWSDWEKSNMQKIKGKMWEPSVCIDSGWGVHLYWFLNKAVDLTDPILRKTYEDTSEILSCIYMSDAQSSTPSHLMRLPGSFNCKSSPVYKEGKIIYQDRDRIDFQKFSEDIKYYFTSWYDRYQKTKYGGKNMLMLAEKAKLLIDKIEGKVSENKNYTKTEGTRSMEASVLIKALQQESPVCPLLDMAVNSPSSIGFSEWMSVGCGLAKIFNKELAKETFYQISLPGNIKPNPEADIKEQFELWAARGLMPCNCTNVKRMNINCPKAQNGTCKSIIKVLYRIAKQY